MTSPVDTPRTPNRAAGDDTRVPLMLRPANPPLPFVGRVAERARLIAAIERGHVAVVCGFPGVGKSGLLLSVLAERFAIERERTLVIDAKESADVVAASLHELVLLGACAPVASTSPAQDVIAALDAASLWLLIDSLERVDDRLRELLALAERFCRRARVLCVCREDPRIASLAPQTVTVGPMSPSELRALLDEVQPGLSESEAAGIIAHAKGSPWRLRQLSMGGVADDAGPEKSLLMLSPIAVGLLRTLALVPSSIPVDVVARATRMPDAAAIESLARRGYLEISARGIRLHDAARPLVDALFEADEREARGDKLVRAIVDAAAAELAVVALPLMRGGANVDALRGLLAKQGATLCAQGHAALASADLATARAHFARAAAFPTSLESVAARLGALAVRLAAGELHGFEAELAATIAVLHEREAPPALAGAAAALTSSFARLSGRAHVLGPREPLPSLDAARKARARLRDAGRALDALDASVVCIDAALVARDRASVAVEAEQLAQANALVHSKRFALDARFAALVAHVAHVANVANVANVADVANAPEGASLSAQARVELVELAQVANENPVVARRAAALLGESVPLDDVDQAVLAALSEMSGARPHAGSVVREAAGPEWTVDASALRIILADGRTVDLSHRKVLFDLLATLCTNGGAATKEQLLERAWGVREYHPLQHDNRLKVAVRKLRRLLEEVLGADPIETAEDGYRLRGKVRFLK